MGRLTIFRNVSQKPSLYAYADVSSWWSKSWYCLYLHPYFVCASSGETFKNAQAYWIRGEKLACTDR